MQSVILGTAQWGLEYGTTNRLGRLPDPTIQDLVVEARAAGISAVDTSPVYGDAETRVARWASGFAMQTKVSVSKRTDGAIRESIHTSLARLESSTVDTILIHDWPTLHDEERNRVAAVLEQLRAEGLTRRVGVSGYSADDLQRALESFSILDVVQLPVNVLDQRLEASPAVPALRDGGGVLQARSVLLQGAAVAPPDHHAFGLHPDVVRLREAGSALDLCMGYVATRPWVDEVVVAATSGAELVQLLAAMADPPAGVNWSQLASTDLSLLDPRQWTQIPKDGGTAS